MKQILSPFESMSKKMGTVIMIYGAILCAAAIALRAAAPHKSASILITMATGVLAFLIGVAAWAGERRRRWIVITSAAFTLFMVSQAVGEWTALSENSGAVVRIITTLGALAGLSMLLYGVHGKRPPEFYQPALPHSGSGERKEKANR